MVIGIKVVGASTADQSLGVSTYTLVGKFECCGMPMVTVIIEGTAACVMPERDYNRIIETERKYIKCNRNRVV